LFDSQSTTQLEFHFQTLDEIAPPRRRVLDLKLVAHHDALDVGADQTFMKARAPPVRSLAATTTVADREPSTTFPVPSTTFRRRSVERLAVKLRAGAAGDRPSASTACSAASRVLTSERYDVTMFTMAQAKRATVYLEPTLHRALRVKAAETDLSVSELVNNAIRAGLAEDAEDLEAFRSRAKEPTSSFENLVSDLKRRGKL
jgi:hypothetical protein